VKRIALLYHDVVEPGEFRSSGFASSDADIYKLEREAFHEHLEAISGSNAYLLFTFDDGGVSFLDLIAPALERHGWRGLFFIATNWIGSPGFLKASQIAELRQRGHHIGTHSCSHPERMSHCAFEEIVDEWRRSACVLEDIIGETVQTGSVPGGFFSRKVARAAAKAGLRALFTSEPTAGTYSVNGCAVLGRFTLQQGASAQTAAALARGQLVPCLQQSLYWNAKKILKIAGGAAWLKLRRRILQEKMGS
jgi:peptidoglycan/xylan/chitin deacetylase (PgdA/CDA1 family)